MTDREKLIALYKEWWEAPFDDEEECKNCTKDISNCNECLYGKFADYLISNGVVVRDKGEWIDRSPYMGHYCSRCGRITGNAILYDGTLISKFCDNCGADMRGEHGN